ncbi:MAG: hypothetical protein AAF351_06695 [Pseudomonadota bacterium]
MAMAKRGVTAFAALAVLATTVVARDRAPCSAIVTVDDAVMNTGGSVITFSSTRARSGMLLAMMDDVIRTTMRIKADA